jgi:hypothetical protein
LDVQIATGNVEHVIPFDDAESKALIETHEHAAISKSGDALVSAGRKFY